MGKERKLGGGPILVPTPLGPGHRDATGGDPSAGPGEIWTPRPPSFSGLPEGGRGPGPATGWLAYCLARRLNWHRWHLDQSVLLGNAYESVTIGHIRDDLVPLPPRPPQRAFGLEGRAIIEPPPEGILGDSPF